MENYEINVTEETMNTVGEVAKNTSKKGLWIALGAAAVGGLTLLGVKLAKRIKAKKAEKEAVNDENWTEELDNTVQKIKDEDID